MTHEPAVKRDYLSRYADVAAAHASFFDQLARDEFRSVDGGGEADSLRGQNDRRVDADHLAARVYERPAGVPRVQGRVGLNDVVDQAARPRTQRAPQRADHAPGHRVLEAVWVPDGDSELADANLIRIAECDGNQVRRVDPDYGQIGFGIVADQLRLASPTVEQRHLDLRRAVDDVVVGQQKAVGREDESGAAAAPPGAVRNLDVDHRRADLLGRPDDRLRIGVEQFSVGQRRRLVRSAFLGVETPASYKSEKVFHLPSFVQLIATVA